MREQANMTGDNPKWLVLDGDIDPMWIESLNTLMDDNKASNLISIGYIFFVLNLIFILNVIDISSNFWTHTQKSLNKHAIIFNGFI